MVNRYRPAIFLLFFIAIFLLAQTVLSYSPPPPPPPPCGYQTPGCYALDETKLNEPTTPQNFGYYLGQNACIGGGCTCGQAGFLNDIKNTDPDDVAGACSCVLGTSWTEGIGCCGDDRTDCGLIADETRFEEVIERHLCSLNEDFIGSWLPAGPNIGLINYVACNEQELLSDGEDWIECNSFGITEIDDREYICAAEFGDQGWIECCGSGSCKSDSTREGDTLRAGESVQFEDATYYCASDKTIVQDLDIKDQLTCNNAKYPNGTSAGLRWTGTLCCSEADDQEEYYNDAEGTIGGCWNKKVVLRGDSVPGIENIANLDGVFYGCNVQDSSILILKDTHTGQQLVQNQDYCFQDPDKFYFCSFGNNWEISNSQDRSHLSTVPDSFQNVQQPSECCSASSCWDGSQCVQNQRNSPNSASVNGYRCLDGNWVDSSLQFNPAGDTGGFCPDQGQCFVNPSGNPDDNNNPDKNPVCITNEQFIKDDYCENGQWTSRTKFMALQLIDIAKASDFTVFCDTPENTLNNLDYQVQQQSVRDLVTIENTNNFCTLIFGNKVLVGTSLNRQVDQIEPFLRLLDVANCNAALANDGQYHACDSSNKVWYNQKLNSIIYSRQSFTISTTNFLDTFINFIRDPFQTIKDRISSTIQAPFDTSYIDSFNTFSKLYISKNAGKEIRGSVEGRGFKNLAIEYKNFNTDICLFINEFNEKNSDPSSGIECSRDGDTYYALAQGTQFTKIDPDAIWNDLTSKLRLG